MLPSSCSAKPSRVEDQWARRLRWIAVAGVLCGTPACGEDAAVAGPEHRSLANAGGDKNDNKGVGGAGLAGAPGTAGAAGKSSSYSGGSSGTADANTGTAGLGGAPTEPDTGAAGATAGETGLSRRRSVYLTSDNINSVSADNGRMDSIVVGLQSKGVSAVRWGLGPNTHVEVIQDPSTEGGLIVDIYGGACAGTIWEMGTDWYKTVLGNRKVFSVWVAGTNITGLDWLPKAWDDNFSPSWFTGLAHPDEYLHNNGYDYIYSTDLNVIIDAIADQAKVTDPIAQELAYQSWVFHGGKTSDVDGDGRQDVCGRGIAGISCYLSKNGVLNTTIGGPPLSDGQGWWDPSNFSTLRLGDINGDGLADLCARSDFQIVCYPSSGSGFGAAISGPKLDDAGAWNSLKYYSTVQLADVDGDGRDDVCARGLNDFACWKSTGTGFGDVVAVPLPDAEGWNLPEYGGTLRMGDINGDKKADVCVRGIGGMRCWVSNGEKFVDERGGPAWSDEQAWGGTHYEYWSTIRLADIDGDGLDDLCARAAAGIVCSLSTGTGFGPIFAGPDLSDSGAWNDPKYFSTIRFGDVNGDGKQDLCARGLYGLSCWTYNPSGFTQLFSSSEFSDVNGWSDPAYYRTITLADYDGDGKQDVCARRIAGWTCWKSKGTELAAPTEPIDPLSDAAGWNRPQYYATIRMQGVKSTK